MFKNKIKLSIIEDYINIKSIYVGLNAMCKDSAVDCLLIKAKILLETYEKLIFKLGLMDCSFLVLNKQINSAKILSIQQINQQLSLLEESLSTKIKKLSLNEIEQKYITNNLNLN